MARKKDDRFCVFCDVFHKRNEFYKSYSSHYKLREVMPFCKNYIFEYVKESEGDYSTEKLIEICRIADAPFISHVWERACSDSTVRNPVQEYFATINIRYRNLTFLHSEFSHTEAESNVGAIEPNDNEVFADNRKELEKRWGTGFEPDTLRAMEKKYGELRVGYSEQTAMHTEALKKYVMASTMEEEAIARGDATEASKWGDLAIKYSKSAKIQPSQLTQSDLQGGLSNVSEIVKAIEREEDIIDLLPKFKEAPQDDVDKVIYLYLNSVSRLMGKGDIDYKDMYKYVDRTVEERKKAKKDKSNDDLYEIEDSNLIGDGVDGEE